ncbi:autophagy-related protein 22-like protein [Lactarius akahatsu]|uniref:Autophagy-related protein n=1 Tax=Lactarius akahatsu TaxID=416441 RepID=A0AAD4LDH9_9AGAM|nr:autophagy-related protein 22-like protein [Lactarius akahatsu]
MSSHILEATPVSELALPEVRKDGSASKSVIVAPAALLEPVTTRRELWCYYLFQFGNNGLATAAGYDPIRGPGSSCLAPGASRTCVLPWGSGTKEVSSIALVASGLGFAIMALVFATIGPAADYRTFGRWLLLVSTAICWAAQFASMTLTSPSRWGAAMALYIISFASQGIVTSFFAAIFPQLARNTPHSRELRVRHERGELSLEAYEKEISIERSKISSVSMACFFIGQVFALPLNLSLLLPLSDNPKVDNYVIVLSTGYWVLFGIWWCKDSKTLVIFQQPRPGPKIPKGGSYLTAGWRQIFVALKQYKRLPNTFAFLFSTFLLSDHTYLTLVRVVTCGACVVASWYIQRHWKLDIKMMFLTVCILGALIPIWGMIGIWTGKFGFHNSWEFWVYNVMFGLAIGPNYAISQTMMCELSPPGFEYMFFGLYGLFSRSASVVGPNVIQVIINKNGNNWKAFPVLAVLIALACIVALFWIDVPKGRSAAVQWATEQRSTSGYEVYSESDGKDSESSKSEGKSKGNI